MHISSNRLSVSYYPDSGNHNWNRADIQESLFKEDFYRNLLNPKKSKDSKISILPDAKETQELLQAILFSRTSYRRPDFIESMAKTLEFIASDILRTGYGFYEIVSKEIFPEHYVIELDRIIGERFKIRKGKLIQYIPESEALRLNTTIKHEIPLEKILKIEFPKELGGKRGLNKFLDRLKQFSEHEPTFNFMNSPLEKEKNYNLNQHRKLHTVRFWKLTAKYGWDHRRPIANDEDFTEYFYLRRKLQFRRNQIIFRDHITKELNEFINLQKFSYDGKPINIEFNLQPTVEDLDKAICDWEKGDYDIDFIVSLL